MKKYKVTWKIRVYPFNETEYFDTYREACEFAKKLRTKWAVDIRDARAHRKPVELREHHTALAHGYWPVRDDAKTTTYRGRFGVGYIQHRATLRGVNGRRNNSYHRITYYVESEG